MSFDLEEHLIRQREFSFKTFGPGERTAGVCDHIRKELNEVIAAPDDIMEWVDVIILAFDGAWRVGWRSRRLADSIGYLRGHEDIVGGILSALNACEAGDHDGWLDIVNLALRGAENMGWPREAVWHAMLAKQIKNEARIWPDWQTVPEDKAIEHVREQHGGEADEVKP